MAQRKQNISTTSASDNPDADEIINDPSFLAKFQGMGMDASEKAYQNYKNLPPKVKRRVLALKKLQLETFKVESQFFRRMTDLEKEFETQYASFHEKRSAILNGKFEPTDSDCDFKEDESEDEETVPKPNAEEAAGDNKALENGDDNQAGIPEFWLTIFNNVPLLSESKEECDDAILKHLTDIKCVINAGEGVRSGFTLNFHFSPNDYFTDSVLTKQYFVRFDPSENDPLSYEGPEIIEAKGCVINWKPGKNVTVKTVRKTAKKAGKQPKTVTKTVKTDSFFNFFSPPEGSLDALAAEDEIDEELDMKYQSDFELGQFIREQVIPRAVLFYTGEGIDDDEEYGDSENEEEEEDEEDSAPRGKGSSKVAWK